MRGLGWVSIVCLAVPTTALAQTRWTTVTPLSTTRTEHVAVVLPDGQLLIAGGRDGSGSLDTAEIYDPSLNMWMGAGTMSAARTRAKAILLPSGRVLVTGGNDGTNTLDSADIYDPGSGWVTVMDTMDNPRENHEIVIDAADGAVYVLGGYEGATTWTTTDIFADGADTFSTGPTFNTGRDTFVAAPLLNSGIIAATGFNLLDSAELFSGGMWTNTGALALGRDDAKGLTLSTSGAVLLTGGRSRPAAVVVSTAGCELWGSSMGMWSSTGSMNVPRHAHGLVELTGGSVFAVGGFQTGFGGDFLTETETYSVELGMWTPADPLETPRAGFTTNLLPDGRVISVGGCSAQNAGSCLTYEASVELWDPCVEPNTTRSDDNDDMSFIGVCSIPANTQRNGAISFAGDNTDVWRIYGALGEIDVTISGDGPVVADLLDAGGSTLVSDTGPDLVLSASIQGVGYVVVSADAASYTVEWNYVGCLGVGLGENCDDRDPCTHSDACDVAEECVGTPISCTDDPTLCGVQRRCNGTASCTTVFPNGDDCDDSDPCTHTDQCDGAGSCVGTSKSCLDDPTVCGANRTCNGTSTCTVTFPDGATSCDDTDACTYDDACDGAGSCAGATIICVDEPTTCGARRTCNGTSACAETFPVVDTPCDDGDLCTTDDICDGQGGCGGVSVDCDDEELCTTDSCIQGTCEYVDICTTCVTNADCVSPTPCTVGFCAGDTCAFDPLPGAACDDGNSCTAPDQCGTTGNCRAGTVNTCAGVAQAELTFSGTPTSDGAALELSAVVSGDEAVLLESVGFELVGSPSDAGLYWLSVDLGDGSESLVQQINATPGRKNVVLGVTLAPNTTLTWRLRATRVAPAGLLGLLPLLLVLFPWRRLSARGRRRGSWILLGAVLLALGCVRTGFQSPFQVVIDPTTDVVARGEVTGEPVTPQGEPIRFER